MSGMGWGVAAVSLSGDISASASIRAAVSRIMTGGDEGLDISCRLKSIGSANNDSGRERESWRRPMRGCGAESGNLGLRPGSEERLGKGETGDQSNEAETITITDCPACGRCSYFACPEGKSHCAKIFKQSTLPRNTVSSPSISAQSRYHNHQPSETIRKALIKVKIKY